MKEELKSKDYTIEQLKSTETAISLFDNKFKEMNAKNEAILKQKSDVI